MMASYRILHLTAVNCGSTHRVRRSLLDEEMTGGLGYLRPPYFSGPRPRSVRVVVSGKPWPSCGRTWLAVVLSEPNSLMDKSGRRGGRVLSLMAFEPDLRSQLAIVALAA